MKSKNTLVLIIGAAIVIGAGFWIFTDNQSNWKTYTDETYGFQIQYPADAEIFSSKDNDILSNGTTTINISFKPLNSKGKVSINVRNIENACYDTALGADPDFPIINGIKFTRWAISKYLTAGGDEWGVGQQYCVARNMITYGLVKQISYTHGTNPPNIESDVVLNQILSSFKFSR